MFSVLFAGSAIFFARCGEDRHVCITKLGADILIGIGIAQTTVEDEDEEDDE